MLLQGKHAVIYGGGGAIGGAVARAFVASDRAGATTGAIVNLTRLASGLAAGRSRLRGSLSRAGRDRSV